jgi:hypothetical protein
MDKNVGSEDRGARLVIGIGLALLAYFAGLSETASIVVYILAAYLIVSGLLSRCLIYKVIGVDTTIQEQPYSDTDDRSGL